MAKKKAFKKRATPPTVIYDQLSCGECGGECFIIMQRRTPDDAPVGTTMNGCIGGVLILTCTSCRGQAEIDPMPAHIRVEGDLVRSRSL